MGDSDVAAQDLELAGATWHCELIVIVDEGNCTDPNALDLTGPPRSTDTDEICSG